MNEKTLPTIMIVLSILAAIVYAANGDGRRTVYWIGAAIVQVAVTF